MRLHQDLIPTVTVVVEDAAGRYFAAVAAVEDSEDADEDAEAEDDSEEPERTRTTPNSSRARESSRTGPNLGPVCVV